MPVIKLLSVKSTLPCYPVLWDNGASTQRTPLLPVHLPSYEALPGKGDLKARGRRTCPFLLPISCPHHLSDFFESHEVAEPTATVPDPGVLAALPVTDTDAGACEIPTICTALC